MTEIVLPASVKTVTVRAFRLCSGLKTVTMQGLDIEIGDSAFENDTSLIAVRIPGGEVTVGENVFSGCSSLETFESKGIKEMGDFSFAACTKLKSVTSSDKKRSLSQSAFV